MQNHLDKEYSGAPDDAKSKQNINSQNSTSSIVPNTITNTTHINRPTNRPVNRIKITKTPKIENFIDRMSEKE